MFTLRQLRFLVAVADHLNFTRAAEACFVTQPTLSAGIRELEELLGVPLFERTKRSVMLTPVGAATTVRARKLLVDAEEIGKLALAHSNPFEGELHLGTIPTIGPYLIPHALPDIRKAFPELKVFLREEMTESLIEGLRGGRLETILIALPFETGSLHVEPLFDDGYQLASPPGWPAPRRSGADALNMEGHLMLLEKGHCLQRHALEAYPGQLSMAPDDFAATSLPTLIAMVSEGLGITLLPNLAVDAGVVADGQARLTPLPDACPRHVVLAWRHGSARAELFRRMGQILKQSRSRQQTERPA